MAKRRLQISLLFLDVITLLSIFVFIYIIFEVEIKKILIDYSIEKFYENMRTTQFDFTNAISYLEDKKELSYDKSITQIINYLKTSTLKRSKYDDTIFVALSPQSDSFIFGGSKSDLDLELTINDFDIDKIRFEIDKLPLKLTTNDIENTIYLKTDEKDKKTLFEAYKKKENFYLLKENITEETKEKLRNILFYTKFLSKKPEISKSVRFNFKGVSYIGIAQFSYVGIRNNFNRNTNDIFYPIFIIADRDADFFYLIDRVKYTFLFLLLLIFLIVGLYKFINTLKVTKEIRKVSDMLKTESSNIKNKGVIGESLKDMKTSFTETSDLHSASKDLGATLNELKKTISGISDEELFNAVVTGNNSVLEEHEVRMGVIFLDIQGFTTITERHKNNSMKIVNHIWNEVEDVISKYDGKINKFIGDACLIIFEEHEKNYGLVGYNAFNSAVEILKKVFQINDYLNEHFNPENKPNLKIDFNFRVGMDAGIVKKGKTGTDRNYELGVIGDNVNTASRFEGLNKQYHTNYLFTENAYSELIKGFSLKWNIKDEKEIRDKINKMLEIEIFNVDRARPKGKSEPKEMFTAYRIQNDDKIFLGSLKSFKEFHLEHFSKLLKEYQDSIVLWQNYSNSLNKDKSGSSKLKKIAEEKWSDLAKRFGEFYHKEGFPPAEHFTKTILKYEEFEEYKKNPDEWLTKEKHLVKEPSEDWIRLGAMELDK